MKRVLIIGCPGSGKSTLSRRLAEDTGLPLIHLDLHYHQSDRWPTDPAAKRGPWREFVQSMIDQPEWIVDGNYKGTFDIRFPAADTIIFLDFPRWLTLFRMLKRRLQFARRQRPDMPPEWREKISPDFLHFIWTYRSIERPRVLSLLDHHRDGRTIVALTNPADVNRWLRTLLT